MVGCQLLGVQRFKLKSFDQKKNHRAGLMAQRQVELDILLNLFLG